MNISRTSGLRGQVVSLGIIALSVLSVAIALVLIRPRVAAQAGDLKPRTEDKALVAAPANIARTSQELTEQWVKGLGSEGWFFVSYKEEFGYDVGTDPETNLPLPKKALWEVWYNLDDVGQPHAVVIQRTDIERGNVWHSVWQDGISWQLPADVRQSYEWNYRPLQDHFCNRQLTDAAPIEPGVTREVTERWLTGSNQWQTRIRTTHPPLSNIAGDPNTYVAHEAMCTRRSDTGALDSIEHVAITAEGQRVVTQRTYDFQAVRVAEPSTEILMLLDQLHESQTLQQQED